MEQELAGEIVWDESGDVDPRSVPDGNLPCDGRQAAPLCFTGGGTPNPLFL